MASSKDLPPLTDPFFPHIFYRNQFQAKVPAVPLNTSLKGQTAIVTGANGGLGLECCRQLLSVHLSHLILAVRSIEKGEAAAVTLKKSFPDAKIEVWRLDLVSYESIQAFAARARDELPKLDIAILNAGLMTFKFSIVESTRHEQMLQVNYLSTALLALLLIPVLKRNSEKDQPGRLTIINAALSLVAKPPFLAAKETSLLASFDNANTFKAGEWYNSSKLLMHFFVWKLSELVPADNVVVNIVGLGYIKGTELAREVPGAVKWIAKLFEMLTARSLEDGASTYVDAAVVKGNESHGCYLMSWKAQPFAPLLYSDEGKTLVDRVWQETLEEFKFASVLGILAHCKSGSRGLV